MLDMFESDSEASIDPRASSTSGNEVSDEQDDELGIESSDCEVGIEAWEERDGRDGYDSNGGEGGSGCDGAGSLLLASISSESDSPSSESDIGSSTSGLNGEKSKVMSIVGEGISVEMASTCSTSSGTSSISISGRPSCTASSRAPLSLLRLVQAPNSS